MTMMMTKGWSWILGAPQPDVLDTTHFADDFDGAYLAECPRCGRDCYWNAYDSESMCSCDHDSDLES